MQSRVTKSINKGFLGTFLLFGFTALAEVKTISKVVDVLPEINDQTLVIFDLDNTVMTATTEAGGDAWFSKNVADAIAAGKSSQEAKDIAVKRWADIQKYVTVRPVESNTLETLSYIQSLKVNMIALTARPLTSAEDTLRQLSSIGASFEKNELSKRPIRFTLEREVLFDHGILQVNNTNKGTALLKLLEILNYNPQKIVFVDDKVHNVEDVNNALNIANFPKHIEFRYAAADAEVAAYNSEVAAKQEELTHRLLSNDEAKKLILNN